MSVADLSLRTLAPERQDVPAHWYVAGNNQIPSFYREFTALATEQGGCFTAKQALAYG